MQKPTEEPTEASWVGWTRYPNDGRDLMWYWNPQRRYWVAHPASSLPFCEARQFLPTEVPLT